MELWNLLTTAMERATHCASLHEWKTQQWQNHQHSQPAPCTERLERHGCMLVSPGKCGSWQLLTTWGPHSPTNQPKSVTKLYTTKYRPGRNVPTPRSERTPRVPRHGIAVTSRTVVRPLHASAGWVGGREKRSPLKFLTRNADATPTTTQLEHNLIQNSPRYQHADALRTPLTTNVTWAIPQSHRGDPQTTPTKSHQLT